MSQPITYEAVTALLAKYPYYIVPAVKLLHAAETHTELLDDSQREHLVRIIAANISDEADLRAAIGAAPDEFANFYPDMQPMTPSTSDTIDSFISHFSSEAAAKTPQIEQIVPVAPAIDYAAMMEAEALADAPLVTPGLDGTDADTPASDETSDLISSFLAAVPPKTPSPRRERESSQIKAVEGTHNPDAEQTHNPNTEQTHNPDTGQTFNPDAEQTHNPDKERIEKILENPTEIQNNLKSLVKNREYALALEIITDLSLKNPKKSIYFADQIRFLKKLIQNQAKQGS